MKTRSLAAALLMALFAVMTTFQMVVITAQDATRTPSPTASRTRLPTRTPAPTRTATPSAPNETLEIDLGDNFSPDLVAAITIGTGGQEPFLNCGIQITDGVIDPNSFPQDVTEIPDFRVMIPSVCSNTAITEGQVQAFAPDGTEVRPALFTWTNPFSDTAIFAAGLPLGAIFTPGQWRLTDPNQGGFLVTIPPITQTIFFRGAENTGILAGFRPNERVRAFAFDRIDGPDQTDWQFNKSFEFSVNESGYRGLSLNALQTTSIIFIGEQGSVYISNAAFQENGPNDDPRQIDPGVIQQVFAAQPVEILEPTENPNVVERTDWRGVVQVFVPAGCFLMGSDAIPDLSDQIKSQSQRQVCLTQPYWIDKYEVSNAEWEQFRTESGSPLAEVRSYDTSPASDTPRVGITLQQAQAYAEWRSGRIPTEAEWEYAARGPDAPLYPWGNTFTTQAHISSNGTISVQSHAEGASWIGAWNLSGNVGEWVSDCYDATYDAQQVTDNPIGPCNGANEMVKGSSFAFNSQPAQVVYRFVNPPLKSWFDVGLRVISSAD